MKETQPLKLGCYVFYTCFRNLKKQNLADLAPTFAGQGALLDQWSTRVWCKSDEALHPGNLTKSFDFFGKRKKWTQQLWSPWIEQLSLMKNLVVCNDFWISSDRYISGAISSRDAKFATESYEMPSIIRYQSVWPSSISMPIVVETEETQGGLG